MKQEHDRRKCFRREEDCPVSNCKDISSINKRIGWVGGTFLTVLTIVSAVILSMVNNANSIAHQTNSEVRSFIEIHTKAMINNAALEQKRDTAMELLMAQGDQQQEALKNTIKLQMDLFERIIKIEANNDNQNTRTN